MDSRSELPWQMLRVSVHEAHNGGLTDGMTDIERKLER
jgi:hypothetical protein